jgi:MoaA/NifB/PqqE/SkfB family radical SAM enzyme
MKPAVTVSAWNFCQNRCEYCVSGSNTDEWKIKNGVILPDNEITNFEKTIEWINRYRHGASVHVSGGEPLLRPDIVEQVKRIVDNGNETTIFTNGIALRKHHELLEFPVKWCVTYHLDCGVPVDDWLRLVDPIKSRRHVLHTVVSTLEHFKRTYELKPYFEGSGWNFYEKWDRRPEKTMLPNFKAPAEDIDDIASNRLTLIVPNGLVYPCNNVQEGAIGNVFDLSFDSEKALSMNEKTRSCALRNACSAFQTAALLETI